MLNADLVHQQAERLAKEAAAGCEPPAERIDRLFRLCFARPASAAEIRRVEIFLASAAPATGDDGSAWAALCRSLLAANEFIHVE